MSADTVDDLWAAEDGWESAIACLEEFIAVAAVVALAPIRRLDEVVARAEMLCVEHEMYCRPTCGWLETGECDSGDPECCGCPCDHPLTVDEVKATL